MKTFNLTDPGEGLTEAEIVRWLVAEGDDVTINQVVVEVETSKSLVELPIPWPGRVDALLVPQGQTVDVGTPLIRIDDGSAGDPERTPTLVGYGPSEGRTRRRARKPRPAEPGSPARPAETGAAWAQQQVGTTLGPGRATSRPVETPEPLHPVTAEPSGPPLPGPGRLDPPPVPAGDRVLAKPPLRKYAKDHGVDLQQVTGSGPGGVIRRADVDAVLAARSRASADAGVLREPVRGQHPGLLDRREPIKGVRKATAAAMVSSKFTAPHASEWVTCDVTATMELLDRIRKRREFRDIKISPLLLVAKAVCLALRRTPEMNSSWDEEAQEIVYQGRINLGIAAATPRGLLVPNIKDAGSLDLVQLALALAEVTARAKEGRTQPAELADGSFTITNVGPFGIDAGTPILNPGEAGILALGAISRRPWVVGVGADERIVPRWVTTLAISFDHRLMDGEGCSLFLADVGRILSDPGQALLY